MTASEFAGHIHGVKRSSDGYVGLCPGHEDKLASLSFKDGDKGLVVKCHAGCGVKEITGAVGIPIASLFAEQALPPPPLKTYDYCDEAGKLLFQAVRKFPKGFSQRQPTQGGEWIWNLTNPTVRRVLYRLKDIQGQAEVVICEGEKDVDRLWSLGIAATTNPMGAGTGKWLTEYSALLVASGAKRVVILPDNDPVGEEHALEVAADCQAAGLKVKVVRLAGLPDRGDVSDWLEAGHSVVELRDIVSKWPSEGANQNNGVISFADAILSEIDALDSAPPEFIPTPFKELNWLLCGGLFPGDLIYLAAKGGEGKSALALELARHVSLASGVLIISQEMSVGAVVRRLLSQESKVNARKMKQRTLSPSDWGPLTKAASSMSTRKGWIISQAPTIEAMTAALKLTTGVKLVIVDYLQLLSAKGQDSRAQLEAVSRGLKAFALTHGVAVFCLSAVTTRGEGNQKPSMHWLRGSGMLEHDCDVALLLHQPNSASPNRELIVAKARDAECGSINLTFSPEILHFVETELRQPDPTDQWERA